MRYLAGGLAIAIGIVIAGCSGPPEKSEDELMAQAEYLVREERWAEAIPVLKELIRAYPENSGAHFYLGRCWLNVPEFNGHEGPWLVLAEGELRLALQLFHRQGKTSTIDRFTDTYFELICNVERSKVYLKQLAFLADRRGRLAGATAEGIIAELRQTVDAAKAVDPDSPDVRALEDILAGLR